MEVALEQVNQHRTDFLNDYNVIPTFRDEAILGTMAPKYLMQFMSNFVDFQSGTIHDQRSLDGAYLAPAVVGSYYICQTTTGIVTYFNMIQFSTWCAGTIFTADRVNYPNLYRQYTPQENHVAAQLYLAENVGNWKQVGIVFFSENPSEFLVIKVLYQLFESHDIEIVWMAAAMKVDSPDLLQSLKESSARIVYMGFYESQRMLSFICAAYKYGIRGSKYTLVAYSNSFVDPYAESQTFPEGCTREIILEQYKIIFWVGNFEGNAEPFQNKNTSLGYGIVEFERRLDQKTNFSRTPDHSRRFICHDAMLHALISLDGADRKLKLESNLSLLNFSSHPDVVRQAVNHSAIYEPYEGLQFNLGYSERFESDFRYQGIAQWKEGNHKLHILYRIWLDSNSSDDLGNLSRYGVIQFNDPTWITKNGVPTRDLSNVVHFYSELSIGAYICIALLSASVIVVNIAIHIGLNNWRVSDYSYGVTDHPLTNAMSSSGCFLLTLSAMAHSYPMITRTICNLQIVSLFFGYSLLFIAIYTKLTLFRNYMKTIAGLTHKLGNMRLQLNEALHFRQQHYYPLKINAYFYCTVSAFALTSWLGIHDRIQVGQMRTPVYYDENIDSYADTTVVTCQGHALEYWLGAMYVYCFVPLLLSITTTFSLKNNIPDFVKREFSSLRSSAFNSVVFVILSLITTPIVSSDNQRSIIKAFCCILLSLISTVLLFSWMLIARKRRENLIILCEKAPKPSFQFNTVRKKVLIRDSSVHCMTENKPR